MKIREGVLEDGETNLVVKKIKSYLWWTVLLVEAMILLVMVPPFQKFDEVFHFSQGVNIGYGCFFSNSIKVPTVYDNLVEDYNFQKVLLENEKYPISLNNFGRKWSDKELINTKIVGKCSLGQIGHIPNGIGVWITRWTNNPAVIFFAGRLAGFVFFILIFLWSLRIIDRRFRYLLWFYALMPMVVHQVTAYSYDVVLLSLILPLSALLINKIIGKKVNWQNEILPYVLTLIIGILKITYLPLIGLFILIDWQKNVKRNALLLGLMAVVIGSQYGLLRFITPKNENVTAGGGPSGYSAFVNPTLQRQLLLKDPMYFVDVLKNTFVETWNSEFKETVGVFGWRNVPLKSDWVVYVFIVVGVFILIKLSKDLDKKINISKTILSIGVLILVILMVCVVMYLVWSVVAGSIVKGIQGRYWVPLVPFILIYGSIFVSHIKKNSAIKLIFYVIIFGSVIMSIFNSLWDRYYNLSDTVSVVKVVKYDGKQVVDKKVQLVKSVESKNVFGFVMELDSGDKPVLVPYKYEIMDSECHKTLRYGYLSPWAVQGATRLEQKFDPIYTSEMELCLKIEPLDVKMTDYNVFLKLKTINDEIWWEWLSYEN